MLPAVTWSLYHVLPVAGAATHVGNSTASEVRLSVRTLRVGEEEASLEEQLWSCSGEDPGLSLGRRAGRRSR